jgi:hypothetical protein
MAVLNDIQRRLFFAHGKHCLFEGAPLDGFEKAAKVRWGEARVVSSSKKPSKAL